MAKIHFVAKRPAVSAHSAQVHPRVLIVERQCCDCSHVQTMDTLFGIKYYCHFQGRIMNPYDECSAFEKKVKED